LALFGAASAARADAPLLSDNFSTYSAGNLTGQNGWTQLGTTATAPIQVSGGAVQVPAIAAGAAGVADNQDVFKNFTASIPAPASGTTSVYTTMSINISAAQANPSYFFALTDTSAGFANERLTAKDNSGTTPNTYRLGARVTGQAGYPFAYGTAALTYGTTHTLVVESDMVAGLQNDAIKLFVDPASTDPAALSGVTPYATGVYTTGAGTDPTALGVAILSQFASATVGQDGISISSMNIVSTPEPGSIGLLAAGVLLAARRRRVER